MKVGIITFHKAINYGAVLQAYALSNVVRSMGYECELIDYITESHEEEYKPKAKKKLRDYLVPQQNQERYDKFMEFIRHKLVLSSHKYYKAQDFKKHFPDCDVFIAGSDQIWNTRFVENKRVTDIYFLGMPEFKCKIAYAPSLGASEEKELRKYEKFLQEFRFIFMREEAGRSLMARLLKRNDIQCALDPTFLLQPADWAKLSKRRYTGKPYMLFYAVNKDDSVIIAKKLAAKWKLKMIVISYLDFYWGRNIINCMNAGPEEFLDLIRNAELVCTTSFHATAFSIIMERPFYCIEKNKHDARKINILQKLALADRVISAPEEVDRLKDYHLSYTKARVILEQERARSLDLLRSALQYFQREEAL